MYSAYNLTYPFPNLEVVCHSMSSSNCCFLTCIQVSQEAGQVVWYSHLFQNFPQFPVIHTVKGFGIVNKGEIDVFLELSCFSMIQRMLAIWSLVPLPFLKPLEHLEVHGSYELFTVICKASSDSHFAFLHFFFLGMILIPVSCTVSRTSIHSSSGTLSDLVP